MHSNFCLGNSRIQLSFHFQLLMLFLKAVAPEHAQSDHQLPSLSYCFAQVQNSTKRKRSSTQKKGPTHPCVQDMLLVHVSSMLNIKMCVCGVFMTSRGKLTLP